MLIGAFAAGAGMAQSGRSSPEEDEAVQVDDLVITAPKMVGIPNVGAPVPRYSAKELQEQVRDRREMITCVDKFLKGNYQQPIVPPDLPAEEEDPLAPGPLEKQQVYFYLQEILDSLHEAEKATRISEQVRSEAARGQRTQKDVEDAELERQRAVARFEDAKRPIWGRGLPYKVYQAELEAQKPLLRPADVLLQNIVSYNDKVNGQDVLNIRGDMRNVSGKPAQAPPFAVTILDGTGQVLLRRIGQPPNLRLAAGETKRFNYPLEKPPVNARHVQVTLELEDALMGEMDYTRCPDDDPTRMQRMFDRFRDDMTGVPQSVRDDLAQPASAAFQAGDPGADLP